MSRSTPFSEALAAATTAFDLKPWMVEPDDFSPCPCFTISQPGFEADGHCWRTRHWYPAGGPCEHPDAVGGCCVHVWGDPAAADRLRDLLTAADWYGPWSLTVEPAASRGPQVRGGG